MPCRDGGPSGNEQERLDNVTDMLCKICKRIDKLDEKTSKALLAGGVRAWWEKHKLEDKLRKMKE